MVEDILDSVLDYEEECYREGYDDGYKSGHAQGHLEGRELGIQTGFQRYRSLGIIQGRVDVWRATLEDEKAKASLQQLDQYVQVPSLENNPVVADDLNLQIKKAKTKLRLVAANTKSPAVELHDTKIVFQKDETSIEDL